MRNEDRFAVGLHTFDVELHGFGDVGTRLVQRVAERVAAWQRRNVGVIALFIWLDHYLHLIL
jgi:hypothetical protein